MGYDMYVEADNYDTTPEVGDTFSPEDMEKWRIWKEGVLERDGYYRINIWGMGDMRHLLYEAGCLSIEAEMPWDGDEPIVDADTGGVLPAYKISDNSGWLVTPAECIATAMTWFEGGGRSKARVIAKGLAVGWSESEGEEYTDDKILAWADDFVTWIGKAAGEEGSVSTEIEQELTKALNWAEERSLGQQEMIAGLLGQIYELKTEVERLRAEVEDLIAQRDHSDQRYGQEVAELERLREENEELREFEPSAAGHRELRIELHRVRDEKASALLWAEETLARLHRIEEAARALLAEEIQNEYAALRAALEGSG